MLLKSVSKQLMAVLLPIVAVLLFVNLNSHAATLTNPIGTGADPCVVQAGGNYYLCGANGNIFLKKAKRLQDVADAEPYSIWMPPAGTAYSKEIWAPEIQYIDGRWYIYFAADDGDNYNHRMYVLEGGTDSDDPLNGAYTFKGKIADSSDQWAIDGTVLTYGGSKYFVWSGWPSSTDTAQYIYIAPMSNAWTISGPRVEISGPDYSWEITANGIGVNEGPEVLDKNGTVSIIYSADASWTDDYCLGQLKLTGTNPLSKSSWTKKSTPVFQKTTQVFGPGHCSFTKSPNGAEDWIVYHAAKSSGSGWDRNVRIQKFTWNTDNTPNFGTPVNPGTSITEPSGTVVVSGKYEAESATLFNCRTVAENNASGGLVAGFIDYADSYVQFNVNVGISGKYLLNVRNCNGSSAASSHNVYVNGSLAGSLNYINNGWDNFTNSSMLITLNAGNNTIKFMKGTNYAEIDCIEISDRFEAENAMLYKCSASQDIFASGTKLVGHIDYSDSYVEFWVNVPVSGKYVVTIANDNGSGATSSQKVYANGSLATYAFYMDEGWTDFTKAQAVVTLNAGNNKIKLMKGDNYAQIDYIKVRALGSLYEAENATLNRCQPVNEAYASGGKVAGYIDYADSYVQFSVNAPASGYYLLTVRNCNGTVNPDYELAEHVLYVNGNAISYLFYSNLGWDKYSTTSILVNLNAGSNTIKLNKNYNYAEIDYIEISQ